MDGRNLFTAHWPSTEPRLRAILGARGHGPDDLSDITQQTAERAIRRAEFDSPGHFVGWCIVVAKNLSTDLLRRAGREVLGEVPERTEPDVADLVAASMTSASILAVLDELTPARRDILINTKYLGSDRREAKRRAVERFRLRQELRRVVEGFAAVFWGRWHIRAARRLDQVGEASPNIMAAAGAVGIAIVTIVGVVVSSGAEHRPAEPRVGPVATAPELVAGWHSPGPSAAHDAAPAPAPAPSPAPPSSSARPDPRPFVRIPLGPGGDSAPGVEVGPRKPDETHFFCGGQTLVTPYFCLDSPSQILQPGPTPPG